MSAPNPRLRTPNLALRPAIPSDAAPLAAIFANPENTQHEPHTPADPTIEEYHRRIAKWDELRNNRTAYFLVITRSVPSAAAAETGDSISEPAADRLIGFGGINSISTDTRGKRVADLGVLIDSSEWRKGYGREALEATLGFAFGRATEGGAGCEEVFLETLVGNGPFQGLMERMGFARWKRVKNEGKEVEYRFSREDWEGVEEGRA